MISAIRCVTIFVVFVLIGLISGPFTVTADDGFAPSNVGLSHRGILAAFGDLDSDKRTDLFYIVETNGTHEVHVYMWRGGSGFTREASCVVVEPRPITALATADFDYDGKLDLLVMGESASGHTYLHVYLGNLHSLAKDPIVLEEALDQVLVMDVNGDLRPDLFGEAAASGQRAFWINRLQTTGAFDVQGQALPAGLPSLAPLSRPHSSAFVDLDGDCAADLVVTSKRNDDSGRERTAVEIWLNRKANGFEFLRSSLAPLGTGQIAFSDIDGDGTIDVLFPVCYPAESCAEANEVHVFFNQQKSMCSQWNVKSTCRAPDALCQADPSFSLAIADLDQAAPSSTHVVLPLAALSPPTASSSRRRSSTSTSASASASALVASLLSPLGALFSSAPASLSPSDAPSLTLASGSGLPPPTLRLADFDLDGYPDLLLTINSTTSSASATLAVTLRCAARALPSWVGGRSVDGARAPRRLKVLRAPLLPRRLTLVTAGSPASSCSATTPPPLLPLPPRLGCPPRPR